MQKAECRMQKLLLISAFCLLPSAFGGATNAQSLSAKIDAAVATPPFDHAIWGIEVEDEAGNVLYARNAHVLMMPASNRKLFSAATDVNCIGLDTRLTTELWLDGNDVIL